KWSRHGVDAAAGTVSSAAPPPAQPPASAATTTSPSALPVPMPVPPDVPEVPSPRNAIGSVRPEWGMKRRRERDQVLAPSPAEARRIRTRQLAPLLRRDGGDAQSGGAREPFDQRVAPHRGRARARVAEDEHGVAVGPQHARHLAKRRAELVLETRGRAGRLPLRGAARADL